MNDLLLGVLVSLYMLSSFFIPFSLALFLGVKILMAFLIGLVNMCAIMLVTCEVLDFICRVQSREREWYLANFKRLKK